MTTTTTLPERTKQERLAAEGYRPAAADGTCGLCRRPLFAGQWAKSMPPSWEPGNGERAVHWRCFDVLLAAIRAKAAGQPSPRLPWQRKSKHRGRDRKLIDAAAPYVEADGVRAAAFVATVRRDTGTGPTWRELGSAMGWPGKPYGLGAAIVHGLARCGWLRFGGEERSLRPGPAAQGLANGRTR